MNIWLSLNKALSLYGDKIAIIDGGIKMTYTQVGQRIAGLAQHLLSAGIGANDIIAIAAPNCHQYLEAYYACGITGITLCPLNYRLATTEIVAILHDCDARALIVHTDFIEQLPDIVDNCPSLERVIVFGPADRVPLSVPVEEYESCLQPASQAFFDTIPYLPADHLAQIYYTSGTTGKPKGVMLSQGNVSFNALAVIADISMADTDVWLHAAPQFHLADAWATFAVTWAGGTHVFIPYFDAQQSLDCFKKHKITLTVLVPTMLNSMLNLCEQDPQAYDCSSWRLALTGGSPIAPDVVRRAIAAFGCEYMQLYGLSETSPFLTLSKLKYSQLALPEDEQLSLRSRTGRPYIGAEVKVVTAEGTEVQHNDQEVGEIIARGPTIFAGYWKQPEVTARTLINGWIHTADLATVDKDGSINIVDRAKDMIITGGENVYSNEVEYVLYEHPSVLECAVFGIPDDHWGESVKAVVVCRKNHQVEASDLIAYMRQHLAHYKVPRSIDFASELPKTGSGKIYKKGLRDHYWQSREKQVN